MPKYSLTSNFLVSDLANISWGNMPPDPPDTTRSMYTTLKQLAIALLFDYKIKLFVKSIDASLVLRPFQLSSKMFSLYGKQYTDFFVVPRRPLSFHHL